MGETKAGMIICLATVICLETLNVMYFVWPFYWSRSVVYLSKTYPLEKILQYPQHPVNDSLDNLRQCFIGHRDVYSLSQAFCAYLSMRPAVYNGTPN